VICLSRQLCEVNFFHHEHSRQLNRVFSGIFDDTGGVEDSL